MLYIPNTEGLLFIGDVESESWNAISCFPGSGAGSGIRTQIKGISNAALYNYGADQTIAVVSTLFLNSTTLQYSIVLFSIDDTLQVPSLVNPAPFLDSSPYAIFPIEEVMMNRDITIDAIGIIADADVVDTAHTISVTPSIASPSQPSGINYSILLFNSQTQFLISYPTTPIGQRNTLMFTDKYPQLTINIFMNGTTASSLRIYKIVMYCSFDPDQAP